VKEGEEFGVLTSLPVSHSRQIEKVYMLYSKRWKIEVNGNRELKHGWYLNKFPSQSWDGICVHIYFTLFMFNTVTAFKSKEGRALTEKGILSLRNKYFKPSPHTHMITVIADGCVATFSFKEFLDIFGLPHFSGKKRRPTWVELPNGKKEL